MQCRDLCLSSAREGVERLLGQSGQQVHVTDSWGSHPARGPAPATPPCLPGNSTQMPPSLVTRAHRAPECHAVTPENPQAHAAPRWARCVQAERALERRVEGRRKSSISAVNNTPLRTLGQASKVTRTRPSSGVRSVGSCRGSCPQLWADLTSKTQHTEGCVTPLNDLTRKPPRYSEPVV